MTGSLTLFLVSMFKKFILIDHASLIRFIQFYVLTVASCLLFCPFVFVFVFFFKKKQNKTKQKHKTTLSLRCRLRKLDSSRNSRALHFGELAHKIVVVVVCICSRA